MRSARLCATVAVVGIIVAVLLPLSPALSTGDVRQARSIGAILTGIVCVAFGLSKGGRPFLWTTISIVSAAAGLILLVAHVHANATCERPVPARSP